MFIVWVIPYRSHPVYAVRSVESGTKPLLKNNSVASFVALAATPFKRTSPLSPWGLLTSLLKAAPKVEPQQLQRCWGRRGLSWPRQEAWPKWKSSVQASAPAASGEPSCANQSI